MSYSYPYFPSDNPQTFEQLAEQVRKLGEQVRELGERLRDALAALGSAIANGVDALVSWGLDWLARLLRWVEEGLSAAGRWLLDFLSKVENLIRTGFFLGDLRDYLNKTFIKAFKPDGHDGDNDPNNMSISKEFILHLPTSKHTLEGDAYTSYKGLIDLQVTAVADIVSAASKLAGQANTGAVANGVFIGAVVVMGITFIFGMLHPAATAAAVPVGTAAAPAMASGYVMVLVGAFTAAVGATVAEWATATNAMQSIKEIGLMSNNKWPSSTLDYEEG